MTAPGPTEPCLWIVDDDPEALRLSRSLLEKAHVTNRIVTVCGGRKAMTYLANACRSTPEAVVLPAVILLARRMTEADGFAVVRWMRRRQALNGVKVVILSNSAEPNDVKQAELLGTLGYFSKCPNAAILAYVFRHLLESAPQAGMAASA